MSTDKLMVHHSFFVKYIIDKAPSKILSLDGGHFRCVTHDLRHQKTDWDETLGVYRVHSETMHGHIFDFRSEVQTGSWPSPYDIGIILARNFTWW